MTSSIGGDKIATNKYNFPDEFWKIKNQDDWVRENFYKDKLDERDPYYNLIKIKTFKDELDMPGFNIYIAGIKALELAGYNVAKGLTDYYTTSKIIDFTDYIWKDNYNISETIGEVIIDGKDRLTKRLYSSPSEIAHSVDIGAICNGESIWLTKKMKYMLDNNVFYFDPDVYSKSYLSNLLKLRDIEIVLPHFDNSRVNIVQLNAFRTILFNLILRYLSETDLKHEHSDYFDNYIDPKFKIPSLILDKLKDKDISYNLWNNLSVLFHSIRTKGDLISTIVSNSLFRDEPIGIIRLMMRVDPVLAILLTKEDIYISKEVKLVNTDVNRLRWIIDRIKLKDNTFVTDSIDDLEAFYTNSTVYK